MADWQTIDTAPKDGTEVLLWLGDDVALGYWREDAQAFDSEVGWIRPMPTHWMPLPDPPK